MSRFDCRIHEYTQNYQSHSPILIQKICVLAIAWSLVGLLNEISLKFLGESFSPKLGQILLFAALIYYATFGLRVFAQMCFAGFLLLLALVFCQYFFPNPWPIHLTVFVVSWLLLFWGRKHKEFSLRNELKFLLIGPLWALNKQA